VTRYAGLDPSIVQSGEQHRQGRISKTGSPFLRTLPPIPWPSGTGPLGQFYARKAQEIGPRKAIIALARKLLIVAWRMLLTGEVYRAVRATTVARKHRELQKKIRIQMPSTVPIPDPARHPTAKSRRRENGEGDESTTNTRSDLTSITGGNPS
jgi:hypothetical protein